MADAENDNAVAGGPIDTIIGRIARTIGGWWAGRAVSEAATSYTDEDDSYYRERYQTSPQHLADRRYEEVRPAYQLGRLARKNPEYAGRDFESIEPELRVGWADQVSSRYGDWAQVREYARDAYAGNPSLSSREAAVRDRSLYEKDKGDDGHAEARLSLPVSRR
jgi:hypothetical protein